MTAGLPCLIAVSLLLLTSGPAADTTTQARGLPPRLSDAEFWTLVTEISEPGGWFRNSDNFTSNEGEIAQLFTRLRGRGTTGGVYLGVGPEQNLTYIAAIRPAMAFIIDIRRQAVMQHLMFKAVFELTNDRADFLELLFSKPRPPGLAETTPIQKIWDAFWPVSTDRDAGPKNLARIVAHLTKTHGFTFTEAESAQFEAVWNAFFTIGPVITTRGWPAGGGGGGLTFADLTGYLYDASGAPRSFLATHEDFATVKTLHEKNLIVPVSGDFGGPRAIRAIGDYLTARGATVSAFYVSNVEQYLFQDGKQRAFFDNVRALPVSETSVFIRPYAMRRYGPASSLCPIGPFLAAAAAGRVHTNNDALACVQ